VAPGVSAAFAALYDDLLERDPHVTPEHSRVAILEGRVVGHALLAPRNIRLCGGDCPAGLVGLVVVDPAHRGVGVGTALLESIFQMAKESALALLVLAGDPAYYTRFGFHTAYTVSGGRLPSCDEDSPSSLRAASAKDTVPLTQSSLASVPSGSVTPDLDRWRWLLDTGHPRRLLQTNPAMLGFIATEDVCLISDREHGYARVAAGGGKAVVYELGGPSSELPEFVAAIRRWCDDQGIQDVRLRLPERHAIWGMSGVSKQTSNDNEFQFKVIDLCVMWAAATEELERRIQENVSDWRGSVTMTTESTTFVLDRQSGALQIDGIPKGQSTGQDGDITIPDWGIARLLLGKDDLRRAAAASDAGSVLDRVLYAISQNDPPSFNLADGI